MQRRDFLRTTGVAALSGSSFASAAGAKPNLLYIVIDQLSGLALPYHDPNSRMPNCEGLAKSGVRFTHAYTAGMTCGPSRASLDTGRYSQTLPGGRRLPPGQRGPRPGVCRGRRPRVRPALSVGSRRRDQPTGRTADQSDRPAGTPARSLARRGRLPGRPYRLIASARRLVPTPLTPWSRGQWR